METYRSYTLKIAKVLCVILSIFSLVELTGSIQNEKIKKLEEEKLVYVAENILPSIPKTFNLPKGKVVKKKPQVKKVSYKDTTSEAVLNTYVGNISHYGADCNGCTGRTASGYDVSNRLYYQDSTYGTVRIVAGDKSLPFGTIIRFNVSNTPTLAIVLDRGGAIGFNKKYMFDLLCEGEKESYQYGTIMSTNIEVLRYGY